MFTDMTSASNMQIHTRVSKLLRAEDSDDEHMAGQDDDNGSDTEGDGQDMYDLTDREDTVVQDPGIFHDNKERDPEIFNNNEELAHDANKPSNIPKRPVGPKPLSERKMTTPPKLPAAKAVPRSTRTWIVNGEIMIVPKKKAVKESSVAKPAACGQSKASTQNSNSYTGTRVHATVDKENDEARAKRRRMEIGEGYIMDDSGAESGSDSHGSVC